MLSVGFCLLLPTCEEEVNKLQQKHSKFTYGGCKLDSKLLSAAVAVDKHLGRDAQNLLDRVTASFGPIFSHHPARLKAMCRYGEEICAFAFGSSYSLLRRKIHTTASYTDELAEEWAGVQKMVFEVVKAVAAVVDMVPTNVQAQFCDFRKALDYFKRPED